MAIGYVVLIDGPGDMGAGPQFDDNNLDAAKECARLLREDGENASVFHIGGDLMWPKPSNPPPTPK